MRISLKEALKCICGENRWSYAVFWKIGCRNPSLLVLEECHYEPARVSTRPGISGVDSNDLLLKEWDRVLCSPENRSSQLGSQSVDGVCLLINKMMTNNPIHVVGEGMVGRAAFTGNHQWILQQSYMQERHPSEVLTEVRHQFMGGIQTIAVIPVLPHGVVQIGSTLGMMENIGFVKDVKSFFLQLGSVPGSLVSDNYSKKELEQKIVPSSGPSQNFTSKVSNFKSLIGDRCNQIHISQASRLVRQPSHSLMEQIQDEKQAGEPDLHGTPSLNSAIAKCLSDHLQQEALQIRMPNCSSRGQLDSGIIGAQVIISNPDARINQHASSYNPSPRFNRQSAVVRSGINGNSLTFTEQQLLSEAGLRLSDNDTMSTSNIATKSLVRSNEGAVPTSFKDFGNFSLIGESELSNAGTGLQTISVPCSQPIPYRSVDSISSCLPVDNIGIQFASSCNMGNNTNLISLDSHQNRASIDDKHTQTQFAAEKQEMENDLFQALNIPSAHPDEYVSRYAYIPGVLPDSWVNSLSNDRGISNSQNIMDPNAHLQLPSGDDLFDIVGIDIKNEELLVGWNYGAHTNSQTLRTNAGPDFYSVNDGVSKSEIFSETGSDHLLDAVVLKAHSTSKQNSEDNVSCRTTLTKISSSSVLNDSPTCGQGSSSNHIQERLFSLPSHTRVETFGSSSLKSGCSKDNAVECSQNRSMYGSQISSWVDDSQNMKRDNSISTAHSKRPDETGKPTRKRLRPGENPRPRPKDRQMIQDRVKELREIVPNGGKCSIDALLERTIKHLLFLQSVTKHADKLKQSGESKIVSKEGGLLLKDNFEGGATWAFEVGSHSMLCPIIVEDLNSPRQMLVEMLCEERGFFLEIADIIRGLGLTILKGVMEARNDKVWARFAVEANRDVTRMEVFLSLVRLLEQTMKMASSTAAPKVIDNGNIMVHNAFHQPSVPATGLH